MSDCDLKCRYINDDSYGISRAVYCTNEKFLERLEKALQFYSQKERAIAGLESTLMEAKRQLDWKENTK